MNLDSKHDILINLLKKFVYKKHKDNDTLEIFFKNTNNEDVRIIISEEYGFNNLILNKEDFTVSLFDNNNQKFSLTIAFKKISIFSFNDVILIKNLQINSAYNSSLNLEEIMQIKMYEHLINLQNKNEHVFLKITFEMEEIIQNLSKNIKKLSVIIIEKSIKNLDIQLEGVSLFLDNTKENIFIPFENILIFLDFQNKVIFNKFIKIPIKDLELFESFFQTTIKNHITYLNFKEIAELKSISNENKEKPKIYYVDFKNYLKDKNEDI
ncbi:hypothetical protein AB836_00280 [Rickettsiales bacterium (ex Bugula neritina AB1)]|nr:hypothetical protein AB836_00280 [Rickettsiales bacterium (ex Bugula neritina AB1)]